LSFVLAQDHEIIRISDHPVPRLGHCNINRVEVKIGEQRAYDSMNAKGNMTH
jgi:hypothetical protein